MPILIIALFAIVEFGLLSSNQSLVHSASRAAADAATGLGGGLPTTGGVPAEITSAVSKVLAARGLSVSCIRVEHTNGPDAPYVLVSGTGGGNPAATPPTDEDYVCVSVCVENTELAPNLLELFCLDLDDTYSQHTVCRCLTPCGEDEVSFEIIVEAESAEAIKSTGGPNPNGWNLWSEGTICFTATVPVDGTYTFSSRLWASLGGPEIANAAFLVDGVAIDDFDVVETSFATAGVYSVDVFLTAGSHEFCVEYTNDFFAPPIDRNLFIDWMSVSGPN